MPDLLGLPPEDVVTPHRCRCVNVTGCAAMAHPDGGVQRAIEALVEEVTRFDYETGARSVVLIVSAHRSGSFQSVTGPVDSAPADVLAQHALSLVEVPA